MTPLTQAQLWTSGPFPSVGDIPPCEEVRLHRQSTAGSLSRHQLPGAAAPGVSPESRRFPELKHLKHQ